MTMPRLLLPLALLLALVAPAEARVDDDLYETVRPRKYAAAERMTMAQKAEIKADRKEASRLGAAEIKRAKAQYKTALSGAQAPTPRLRLYFKAELARDLYDAKHMDFLVMISHQHELDRAGIAYAQVPEVGEILADMRDRAEMLEDLFASLVPMSPDQRAAAITAWNALPIHDDTAHQAFVDGLGHLQAELYRYRVIVAEQFMESSGLYLVARDLSDLALLDDAAYAAEMALRAQAEAQLEAQLRALPADARTWRRRQIEMDRTLAALDEAIANW